jgi:hypothetical protein
MTSLDVDILSVRLIYAKGRNQILPANTVLTTDGLGGTKWLSISSISAELGFNSFTTTASTFTSGSGNARFSILDASNIGLLPTNNGAEARLYSKSFGLINVAGQNSINSFNSLNGEFNNTININSSGALTISTNSLTNDLYFYSPNDAISSLSSLITNMSSVNTMLKNSITSFNSPFSTFIYSALSTFSTALGPTVQFPQLYSTLSTFSTALGPTVTTTMFASSLSTNISRNIYTDILNTSTVNVSGNRQPFIQYGSANLLSRSTMVTLNSRYINSNYIIQMTYASGPGSGSGTSGPVIPISFSSVTTSNFMAYGDSNATFHWTTYGNLF